MPGAPRGWPVMRIGGLLLLALLLAAGCSLSSNPAPKPGLVKIGLVVSYTGPSSAGAQPVAQGAAVAVADINLEGRAAGRTVSMLMRDDRGDPVTAQVVCARLVAQDGVSAIVGSQSQAGRLACSRAADQARVPYLALGATDGNECYRNVYFLGLAPNQRLASLIGYLISKRSAKRFFVVSADTTSGQAVASEAASLISDAGGLPVSTGLAAPGTRQFSSMLAQIGGARPDVALDALRGDDAIAYHRQFASASATHSIVQASLQMLETEASSVGVTAAEHYLATDYLVVDTRSTNTKWLSAVETRYGDGSVPTALSAQAYDAVELVAAALSRVKDATGTSISAGLNMVSFTGPRGIVQFKRGSHGYATLEAHIGRLSKNGVVNQVDLSGPIDPVVSCA